MAWSTAAGKMSRGNTAAGSVYRELPNKSIFFNLNMLVQTTLISKTTFGGIFFGLIYVFM